MQADPELTERIRVRHEAIGARIASLTDRRVELVCVTKGHPAEVVAAAAAAGCVQMGESYAQELLAKDAQLRVADAILGFEWQFIGRLQRNKVRQVAPLVGLWHTIDRSSLATEVARRAPGARVLVQLDLAGLPDRGGCPMPEASSLIEHCRQLGLQVEGLMGVGLPGDPERSRPAFRELGEIADAAELATRCIGMSDDLEVAVQEGSTMVRIGRALVGARP